jgi:hypothetical protein
VPSLAIEGTLTPILHRSQLAALLGLPAPDEGDAAELGRDAAGILAAWTEHLRGLPFALLLEPTPSRGRSLRNLTVNVFHPFELLPCAARTGSFDWDPEGDRSREVALADAGALVAYAEAVATGWQRFLVTGKAADPQLELATPRGPITWANLIAQQRWHAAFHYRQLLAVLDGADCPAAHPYHLGGLAGLDLPDAVF